MGSHDNKYGRDGRNASSQSAQSAASRSAQGSLLAAAVPAPAVVPVVASVPVPAAPVDASAESAAKAVQSFVAATSQEAKPEDKQGAFELKDAVVAIGDLSAGREAIASMAQVAAAQVSRSAHTHIAKTIIPVNNGRVVPGEEFTPSAADAALWLSQGCIVPIAR